MNIASNRAHVSNSSLPNSLINIAKFKLAGRGKSTTRKTQAKKRKPVKRRPRRKATRMSPRRAMRKSTRKGKKRYTRRKTTNSIVIKKGFVYFYKRDGRLRRVSIKALVNKLSRKTILSAIRRHGR